MMITGANPLAFRSASIGQPRLEVIKNPDKDPLAEFKAEAKKTPAERVRDEVLKRHGITEKELQNLPDDKRKAIEKEVEEAVRKLTGANSNKASGAQPASGGSTWSGVA